MVYVPQIFEPKAPSKSRTTMWNDALRMALNERRDDGTGHKIKVLRLIARSLVNEALNGERWAHEMIADRIDGPLLREAASSGGVTVIVNRQGLPLEAGELLEVPAD